MTNKLNEKLISSLITKNAKVLEDKFDDIYITSKGLRRAGIIFIKDLFINYNEFVYN